MIIGICLYKFKVNTYFFGRYDSIKIVAFQFVIKSTGNINIKKCLSFEIKL